MAERPKQQKIIGIVGGLGPYAHLDFERKLLEAATALIGASQDQDFPEWILSSVPQTPDRTLAFQGKGDDPLPWLVRSLRRLEGDPDSPNGRIGADFAVIPCNTAHLHLNRLREAVTIPIVSMVEETARRIANTDREACVGLLATTGTVESRLYHEVLATHGIPTITPLDLPNGADVQRTLVMEPIYGAFRKGEHTGGGIKSGTLRGQDVRALEQVAEMLVKAGATGIVAGCTEIPIALRGDGVAGAPLIDPTRVLAETAIRLAYALE